MIKAILLVSIFLAISSAVSGISPTIVRLADGTKIKGLHIGSSLSFRGVPYAEPPIGQLRWAPPIPWVNRNNSQIVDATRYGSMCIQKYVTSQQSEDCLFLNIYSPADSSPSAEKLPVGVFIHGGGYIGGSGDLYVGAGMVDFWGGKGIIVTLNYRLGVFGYLGSEQLRSQDPDSHSTGNYGLQDQRLALDWVKRNIAIFGGDANRVTIFGQSAGAGSISCHLSMKKSWGLFSGAILESGSFAHWIAGNMTLAQRSYDRLAETLQCSDVTCMLSKSSSEVFETTQGLPPLAPSAYGNFQPVADGVELFTHPWVSLANGEVADVSIMHGTNSDEGSMFATLDHNATEAQLLDFWAFKGYTSATDVQTMRELYLAADIQYPVVDGDSRYWWAGQRSEGDLDMSCPAKFASQQLSHLSRPVFLYHFEHRAKHAHYVPHFAEVPFVFHWDEVMGASADKEMADLMSGIWGNFMSSASHDPNDRTVVDTAALPVWPSYDSTSDALMKFTEYNSSSLTEGLKLTECAFLIPRIDQAIKSDFPYFVREK